MPTYDFVAVDGASIEEVFPMSKVPPRIRRKGKVYKLAAFSRQNSTAFADAQVATTTHGYPRVDITFPKGDLGAGTSPAGHPIIRSQAHEREVMAEYGMRRD